MQHSLKSFQKSILYDCRWPSIAQQTADLLAAQSLAAGYFGGYTAKMQDVGRREIQAMEQALERKLTSDKHRGQKSFTISLDALSKTWKRRARCVHQWKV